MQTAEAFGQIANKTKEKKYEAINYNIVLWAEAGQKRGAHAGQHPQNT